MFNSKCVLIGVAIYICFASSAVLRDGLFPLDIIHYNDFHDRFEETSLLRPVCQSNDSSCLGGFARLYYEIKELRKQKPNSLLLNAGDVFFGTYWYALMKWNVAQRFLNMLPHDAHAIGNHEFDDGIEGLKSYLAALQGPVVVANIDSSQDPTLEGLYSPYTVVERNGRKIGIVGVTTMDLPQLSNTGNLKFLDPIKAVEENTQVLTKNGVDIIVVLSHCGLYIDQKIAKKAGENVDLIVGGHTHSLLWNGPSPTKEFVNGPYPVVVESESNPEHKILIVQASAYTKYLGNITVYFDDQGEMVSYDARPVFLNRSIPEDQEIKALLRPYKKKIKNLVNEVVGYSNDDMNLKKCGSQECALGNFIADAFLNSTKEAYSSELPNVVIFLRNMMKGPLSKGNITRGMIINISPFSNKLVTITLAGRYLLAALNQCLTLWRTEPLYLPWMPHVAGMQLSINTTSRRVASVVVDHDDGRHPLDMDKEYQLTVPEFLYKGGDNFCMLKNSRDPKIVGLDSELLEKYVRKMSPLTAYLDNRLMIK